MRAAKRFLTIRPLTSATRRGATVIAAQMIRSRYTVLDLAYETGRFHDVVQRVADVWSEIPGAGA